MVDNVDTCDSTIKVAHGGAAVNKICVKDLDL